MLQSVVPEFLHPHFLPLPSADMKAVFTIAGARVQVRDTEIPIAKEEQVLVKMVAVAQNPTDCK